MPSRRAMSQPLRFGQGMRTVAFRLIAASALFSEPLTSTRLKVGSGIHPNTKLVSQTPRDAARNLCEGRLWPDSCAWETLSHTHTHAHGRAGTAQESFNGFAHTCA